MDSRHVLKMEEKKYVQHFQLQEMLSSVCYVFVRTTLRSRRWCPVNYSRSDRMEENTEVQTFNLSRHLERGVFVFWLRVERTYKEYVDVGT